jgi:hypothetical protein
VVAGRLPFGVSSGITVPRAAAKKGSCPGRAIATCSDRPSSATMVPTIPGGDVVRWLLAAALLLAALAGCTTDDDTVATTDGTSPPATPASTSLAATTSSRPPPSPATTAVATVTTTSSTLDPIGAIETGLLCRDLFDRGYDYTAAVAYWTRDGSPERMDADGNGIPCETVYPEPEVLAFWGDPLPTTTAPPTTLVTIVYAPGDPFDFPAALPGSDEAGGSGCAPGTDDLPDGIWFGYVTGRSAGRLDFDLACIWLGTPAHRRMVEAGVDPVTDFWTSNVNPKIRTVPVASDAAVYHLAPSVGMDLISYREWLLGPCHGFEARTCPVWLYVNGGRVTSVVEQFFA